MSQPDRLDPADSIAQFVVRERKRNGLTQAELADIAGVSERFVRVVEHGKQSVRLDALGALLEAFGARLVVARRPRDADEAHEP